VAPALRAGVTPVLAQAAPDPDLTRPILVIAACAVIIVVTVLIQVVQARRRGASSASDEGDEPQ
jgi:hypothetical protein